jgi:hypothetical protein
LGSGQRSLSFILAGRPALTHTVNSHTPHIMLMLDSSDISTSQALKGRRGKESQIVYEEQDLRVLSLLLQASRYKEIYGRALFFFLQPRKWWDSRAEEAYITKISRFTVPPTDVGKSLRIVTGSRDIATVASPVDVLHMVDKVSNSSEAETEHSRRSSPALSRAFSFPGRTRKV